MATQGDRSQVLDAVRASVCPDSAVKFVVAFGSQVSGESQASSDLDLAVKFADEASDRDRFEKLCFLSGDLQQEDAPFVDLSDIESLPLEVTHDAVNGQFVCGDSQAFEQFKSTVEAQFDDQRETLREHHRGVIDRLAEDGLRG